MPTFYFGRSRPFYRYSFEQTSNFYSKYGLDTKLPKPTLKTLLVFAFCQLTYPQIVVNNSILPKQENTPTCSLIDSGTKNLDPNAFLFSFPLHFLPRKRLARQTERKAPFQSVNAGHRFVRSASWFVPKSRHLE